MDGLQRELSQGQSWSLTVVPPGYILFSIELHGSLTLKPFQNYSSLLFSSRQANETNDTCLLEL
jgi:hypothetical protein